MRSLFIAFVGLIGLTVMANAQCATGYTQLSNVFACQQNTTGIPVITSPGTASGTVGMAFTYQITGTNSPTSWSASGLPAPLGVNTGTGLISGTPTGTFSGNIALGATNASGTGNQTLALTISAAGSAPVITSSTTATGTVGTGFLYAITATNSPTSFSATGLPTPLGVNTTTGHITGTPTAPFNGTVVLGATNAAGTGNQNLALTISSPSAVTAANLASGTDATGRSTVPTASISPSANKLDIVSVASFYAPATANTPTVTGAGGTWVQILTLIDTTNTRRITLFRDMSASPGSGPLTIDFAGQVPNNLQWSVDEFTGVDTSGTHGAGAIVQAVSGQHTGTSTSFTVNLAALGSPKNAVYGLLRDSGSTAISAGAGFTELSNTNTNSSVEAEWAINQTAVGWTYPSNSVTNVGAALEIKSQ